jgi:hypothetical protein
MHLEADMATLTAKENYLRLGRREIPEWVPTFMPYKDHGPATAAGGAFIMGIGQGELKPGWTQPHGDWKDLWGANYTWEEGTLAGLPKPNAFILEDPSQWERVIKHPVVPDFDWAAAAKAELDKVDRSQVAFCCDLGFQPFQQLVAFMGFTETLCAFYEEPEAIKALLNYLADWYVPVIEKVLDYWKPDIVTMADDTAARQHPFFSVQMYKEFFKPIYRRITKPALDRGVFVDFHNCGRCEDFVDDMVDIGVNFWNPCQIENDLVAVQRKHGNRIAIQGGWDYDVKLSDSESTVRGYVRDYLDKYAKNGGFIAFAMAGDFMSGPEEMAKWGPINGWLSDELYTYGTAIYKK